MFRLQQLRYSIFICIIGLFILPSSVLAQDDKVTDKPKQLDRQPQRRRQPSVRLPATVEMVSDVVYATTTKSDGSTHELMLNSFFPKHSGEDKIPAVIYIHGGGYTGGSRNIGNQASAILAAGGYFAVTIDYRLLKDSRLPAAVYDCKAAVRFLKANADELGIDAAHIGVWGHSAGGHLAAFLGVSGNNDETNGNVGDFVDVNADVACAIDYFGPADFQLLLDGKKKGEANNLRRQLFGPDANDVDALLEKISTVYWIDENDPPMLIIHGTDDNVVPIKQSEILNEKLQNFGVDSELIVVEGAGHGIRNNEVSLKVAEFLDTHLGGNAAPHYRRIFEMQKQASDRQRGRESDKKNDKDVYDV